MPVKFDRAGTTVMVTITFDATPILSRTDTDARGKRYLAGQLAVQLLTDALSGVTQTDAQLDQQAADAQAYADRVKANRPTGNL